MIKKTLKLILLATLSLSLAACAVNQAGQVGPDKRVFNKERVIPLGAGLLSAVICNKLWDGHGNKDSWTAICGAAGYFGSVAFMQQHNQVLESNRVGQTSTWNDPDGSYHSMTPTETYYEDEVACRNFRQTVEIDGQTEIMTGKACRQSDGTWKLAP